MHKVIRLEKPVSLKKNSKKWTANLLNELNEVGSFSKVKDSTKNKYNQTDIKKTLSEMYPLCCYCESTIGVSDFENIEHLKPKSIFPELCFEWDNLHFSCGVCNTFKFDKWDSENKIIDPCIDEPNEHIKYQKWQIENKTLRGKTTIEHTNLNRKKLLDARQKVYLKTIEILQVVVNSDKKDKSIELLEKWLNENSEVPSIYFSLVKSVINNFIE